MGWGRGTLRTMGQPLVFIFLGALAIFWLTPLKADALITLTKSTYLLGEDVVVYSTSNSDPIQIYNKDTGQVITGYSSPVPGDIIIDTVPVGNFAVLEVTVDAICENLALNYTACKSSSYFLSETLFSANAAARTAGPTLFTPGVTLISPQRGIFGKSIRIDYEARDENDYGTLEAKAQHGLGSVPVSLFYSTQIETVTGRVIADELKKLIAQFLPAKGFYEWDTTSIPEGDEYRIIVDATDNFGLVGEAVSNFISFDHTAPVFKVKVDPPATGGEDVKVTVEASEELVEPPEVYIVQRGLMATRLSIFGQGKIFSGVYPIVPGHDGTATVTVSGKDYAGNSGVRIVGGGTFAVGIEPPPKPVVASPVDREVFASDTITVIGTAREDTEVKVFVNGIKEYKTRPDRQGNFTFENIKIDPFFNHGLNFLNVSTQDTLGNSSEATSLSVKFNINPEISILVPKSKDILNGSIVIRIDALDKNKDKLNFTYEVSRDNGISWQELVRETSEKRYMWDTTEFTDGQYVLRITADDSFVKVQALSGSFTLRNSLPTITFDTGNRIITNKKEATITGTVVSASELVEKPLLVAIEYSLNKGRTWNQVSVTEGAIDSVEERFSITLRDLREGTYSILFRAKDTRGITGRSSVTLIVDFGPPLAPIVAIPNSGTIVSDAEDANKDIAGLQIAISGSSEPESRVQATAEGLVFNSTADSRGAFTIPNVTVKKHGRNEIKVLAIDHAENKSQETILSVTYNNPPSVRFIRPRLNRGLHTAFISLTHPAFLKWEAGDPDLDKILGFTLSWRKASGGSFTALTQDTKTNTYEWDVQSLTEGEYQLRLEATDGTTSTVTTLPFMTDSTQPEIVVEPLSKTVFTKDVTLQAQGLATDDRSGIEFVEVNIGGGDWFKATVTKGFLTQEATFRITHEFRLEDGSYQVGFRAVDVARNTSTPVFQKIIVDTAPPRIGSYTISKGLFSFLPMGERFQILQGATVLFTISLEGDTSEATLLVGEKRLALTKSTVTNLWQRELILDTLGNVSVSLTARDAGGNVTDIKIIGAIDVVRRGVVRVRDGEKVEGARITVFVFDEQRRSFVQWQGAEWRQQNPVATDSAGTYELTLPPGTYQLLVQKSGFERLRTTSFTMQENKFVTFNVELQKRAGIKGLFEDVIERVTIL